jgi:PAS domain S-box-containing protein
MSLQVRDLLIIGAIAAAGLLALVLYAVRHRTRAMSARELRTLERRGRTDLLLRSTQAGLLDWDGVANRTRFSARFCEMLGYDPDGPQPPPVAELLHPEDAARVNESFLRQLRDRSVPGGIRTSAPIDFRLRRAEGGFIWVHAEGISVCDAGGRVLRFIGSFIDITDRIHHAQELARQVEIAQAAREALASEQEQLRESRDRVAAQARMLEAQNDALLLSRDQIAEQARELEAANAALREAVRVREEVERIARHDIKTPLNTIVAVPRLLREERQLGAEADELLGVVERAGYRILSMVNLSLDLYKMEQGDYVFRPDAVDLGELVEKVAADLRTHAASKSVRLRLDMAGAPYAWAEELLCYSLLANLLKNAIEASPEDAQVTVIGEGNGGDVLVRIHNAGAVPQGMRESFFQKYATEGKASGTGLGTYSARRMARVQEGDVTMRSSHEEGTTLTVRLRAAPPGQVPATQRHAQGAVSPAAQRIAALPPWRILLVDDDEYNLLIVRRFLPSPPFEVHAVVNGKLALAAAEQRWRDVVVMDLDMPVMGGLETVAALRTLGRERGFPRCAILALSSHEDDETRARALAAGFDRYLAKPVTREGVLDTLHELHEQGLVGAAPRPCAAAPALDGIDAPILVSADLRELLPAFVDSRRRVVAQLLRAVADGRRDDVHSTAHQLAGAFGMYGFEWASGHSRWLERECGRADLRELEQVARQLHRHLETVQVRYAPA